MISLFPKNRLVNLLKISLIILFLSFAGSASATHFRYGNLSWSRDPGNPLTINFKLTESWRRGFSWTGYGANPTNPVTGQIINFYSNFPLNFGDGNSANVAITVTSYSAVDDWIIGEFNVSHTYANAGSFLAFMQGVARLSGPLQNNTNLSFRIESNVTVGNSNDAPVSTLPPIVNLVIGNPSATYQIPATDPDGDALTFSLAPSSSFTLFGQAPCSNPVGFSVSGGGLITFNTTPVFYGAAMAIGNLFNAVVRITDSKGAYVHLDVLLKIVGPSSAPLFIYPPTPADQFTYILAPGANLNYTVEAQDPDAADNVTLFVNGLPVGAVMSPLLPFTGPTSASVQSAFSWTPTLGQVGSYVTTYIAQDPQGVQTPTTVKINVVCNSSLSTTVTEPSCFNTTDGSVTITASGTAPFMFSKDGGANYISGSSPYTFSGLGQGDYGIRVKGANGCQSAVSNIHLGLNLVTNGDFEAGNFGFNSSYLYNPGDITPEGTYEISVIPNHHCFNGPDHTPYGPGNAMHVNGSSVANTIVWAQNIVVQPGSNYYFSAWVKGQCFNTSPAILQFSINGGQIGPNFSPTDATTWRQFFTPWNSGANTTATIRLINQNIASGGNDFSLDDIVFTTIAPVTEAVTKTDVICIGANDGTIIINASGGVGPYLYSINGGSSYASGANPYTFSGLAPGNYNVLVKDNCGVESNIQVIIIGTVPDVTPPIITCPSAIIVNNTAGLCSGFVTVPAISVSDNCGVICNTDNLDSYNAGAVSGLSALWVPWNAGVTSAVVSTAQFSSAPNSLKVEYNATNNPDQLYLLGNQTTGKWTVKFKMFVVTGRSGYYNIQHFEASGIQWAHQVIFYSNGTGNLYAGPSTPFNYPQNQWFEVRQEINQNTNQTTLYINNVLVQTWQFSNQSNGAPGANQLGSINFYATGSGAFSDPNPAATSLFYVDDVTLCGSAATMGTYIARRFSKDYPVGVHSVPVSVSDLSGNTASCNLSITVKDNEAPTIVCPNALTVQCALAVPAPNIAFVAASDNCSTVTVSFVSDVISNQTCANKYTITRTYKATDASGNSATCMQFIVVNDNTLPSFTSPANTTIYTNASCGYNASPSNTGTATNITDNCSMGLVATYTDQIANGPCEGSKVITRTWRLVDDCNNAAPNQVQIITVSDITAPTFTRPPDITIPFTSSCGYNSAVSNTGNVLNASDNCSTGLQATYTDATAQCGYNTVITRTWRLVDKCGNPAADQVQNITVSDNNTPYLIYAVKEAKFGENNTINGSVGVTDVKGKAEFKKNSSLPAPDFVRAYDIKVDNNASVPIQISTPASGGPTPPFYNFIGDTKNLPDYTVSVSTAVPVTGNYKKLSIKKNVSVTITGTLFGNIDIDEGAVVTFNPTGGIMNVEEFKTKGKKDISTAIIFTNCTSVRMKDKVDIGENTQINVDGPKVTFCMGDDKKDEEKFTVKGGNTNVNVNVFIKDGKLKVQGDNNDMTTMTGWFIAEKVQSEGKNVTWNKYGCINPPVNARFAQVKSVTVENFVPEVLPAEIVEGFTVKVYPNPSSTNFQIQVLSASMVPVTIRIMDAAGEVRSVSTNILKSQILNVGNRLTTGIYFAEVIQGKNRTVVKLVKL